MNNLPLISILIPVYNVEPFLAACLDSTLAQTWRGPLEILACNDGSTDGSLAMLEEYARRDSRIKVFDQPNRGLMLTRERLLKEASGEFVFILDSDDHISPNAIEVLYRTITDCECDIATARILGIRDGVVIETYNEGVPEKLSATEFMLGMLKAKVTRGVAGRMYRRHLFAGVEFFPEIGIGEDYLTNMQIAMREDFRGICFSSEAIYYYIRNEASMTHRDWYSFDYEELFASKFDPLFGTRLQLLPECRDEWFRIRVSRAHKYIRRSGNPWRGTSPLVQSAYRALLEAPRETRRLAPAGALTVIKLYRRRGFKPTTDFLAMIFRWWGSIRKRLSKEPPRDKVLFV